MLAAAAADPAFRMPRGLSSDGAEIIGVGMAMAHQGNGLGTLPDDPGGGVLRLAPDGAIEALFGLEEMGQGVLAAIRSAVAAELGCGPDDIRPVIGDTSRTPDSGSTTAARTTHVVWRAARETAPRLAAELVAAGARLTGRPGSALAVMPGGLAERGSNSGELLVGFADLARSLQPGPLPESACSFEFPKSDYFKGNARLIFAFGATVARVAIDRVSGQVRVLDLNQHTAAGPMLDHAAYLGQIEGGGVQGLGFTLTENAVLRDGRYLTGNLDAYMVPTIGDAPAAMASFALEDLEDDDHFGPRGIGELGIAAVAPAIANAVADAIGAWPERAPIGPEAILDVLGGRP
jgi:CO/xanthine dehydrogenase Mo-binding subunit